MYVQIVNEAAAIVKWLPIALALIINHRAARIKRQDMWIPESVTKLHKLKILEFRSVARLLKSYPNLEVNPEQVADDFSIFIKVQGDQEQERQKVLNAFSK
jgi:hypothetical protein